MSRRSVQNGYTLVEMIMVIIIIGILATVAFRSLGSTIDTVRTEETRAEMKRLAYAIAGNPGMISNGTRTDFGYIGDIGSLPPDWEALVTDPGYGTWHGPYVYGDLGSGTAGHEYMLDAWGEPYSSPNGTAFSSDGGPETITRSLAGSVDDLLYNEVVLSVEDIDNTPPGNVSNDSVLLVLTRPDGTGGMISHVTSPDPDGLARFDSIPIGIHSLQMIYLVQNDTIRRWIAVNPGRTTYLAIKHYSDVW